MYQKLLIEGRSKNDYKEYMNIWIEAENQARKHEQHEYNIKTNKTWENCKKSDGKKLWSLIDWKGKSITYETKAISPEVISSYFKHIFQSPKITNTPNVHTMANIIEDYEAYVPQMDMEITLDEVNDAIDNIGTGIGLDGIEPSIVKIFPLSLRKLLVMLMNIVWVTKYPDEWQKQLLLPYPKKGHQITDPKLRGIGIGYLLSRLYDDIITNRFIQWYNPNKEQAAYRQLQGCLLQIFAIFLLMELSNVTGNEFYVAFMDYEKAFDFMNRAKLLEKMIDNNAGSTFVRSISSMYEHTEYIPKIDNSTLDKAITTEHGVTQGRKSSANFYSMYVSDMADSLENISNNYMDPCNLLQLADDTATLASDIESLKDKILALLAYSDTNFQRANISKTKYLHFSCTPHTDPLQLDEQRFIDSADKEGYIYLGMKFISSNQIKDHVTRNLNDRMGNIHRFYAWLENNEQTPIDVKLLTLYNGAFAAILYGAETWGNVDEFKEKLLLEERKALKRCLGVKQSTPDDILYIEVNRPDIEAVIKDRQHNFYKRVTSLEENNAVIRTVIRMCQNIDIVKYYNELNGNHQEINLHEKKRNTSRDDSPTMTSRYYGLTKNEHCYAIYNCNINEDLRIIITRWRLSSHDLEIELGRRKGIARESRFCNFCDNCVEDEAHVVYVCPAYETQRERFRTLLTENHTIEMFLNPKDKDTAMNVGKYLKVIEDIRNEIL